MLTNKFPLILSFPEISSVLISHLKSSSILPDTFKLFAEMTALLLIFPLIFTSLATIITSSPIVAFSSTVTVPPANIKAFFSILEFITTSFADNTSAYSKFAFILTLSDDIKNCKLFKGSFTSIVLAEDKTPILSIDLSTTILPAAFLK